jgi:DNA topoisomerase I
MATVRGRTKAAAADPVKPATAAKARSRARPATGGAAEPGSAPKPAARRKTAKPKAAVRPKGARRAAKRPADDESAAPAGGSLVIVESPTKSKTLAKYLGKGFTVMASKGHILDLPKGRMGVSIEGSRIHVEYVPIGGREDVVGKLRTAARRAERVYLAPDPDREGEAIAWHLAERLQDLGRPLHRLTFNEITQRAVLKALEEPREIDMDLVNAQQARRVLDRLVGYEISPFLWRQLFFGRLSAGRVQSVALRLICEREDEIEAFRPEEYWTLEADYATPEGQRFTARLVRVGEETLEQGRIRGAMAEATATALAGELRATAARVASVQTRPATVHPKPPFITSTLQQTAFNRLGFGSQRTMKIAQHLYEGIPLGAEGSVGLITYMRTDSPRLAGEAIGEMRRWLEAHLGADHVPEAPRQYRGKRDAQDAHEAIRPTSVERTPDSVRRYLTEEQARLYELIWKRAVASQAAAAEYESTTAEIEAGHLGLRTSGRVLRFAGFQRLYGFDEEDEKDESRLPELRDAMPLTVARTAIAEDQAPVRPEQHFTQPPPRYTEASLVKTLEEENIGRPSTYATIVGTITGRNYIEREKGRLKPTDLGRVTTCLLVESFPDVFNVGFTAGMEEELDGIEEGKQDWHQVVLDLWGPLKKDLDAARKLPKGASCVQREKGEGACPRCFRKPTDKVCPRCGRHLIVKFGRNGPFYACTGWPECKYTEPFHESEKPVPTAGTCPKCGAGLVLRNGQYGRFIHCVRRPDCDHTQPYTIGVTCPKCGKGDLAEKKGKRKTFYGCTQYPECDFVAWDRPRALPCPNGCGSTYLVEKETKKGTTLRCPTCKGVFSPDTIGA